MRPHLQWLKPRRPWLPSLPLRRRQLSSRQLHLPQWRHLFLRRLQRSHCQSHPPSHQRLRSGVSSCRKPDRGPFTRRRLFRLPPHPRLRLRVPARESSAAGLSLIAAPPVLPAVPAVSSSVLPAAHPARASPAVRAPNILHGLLPADFPAQVLLEPRVAVPALAHVPALVLRAPVLDSAPVDLVDRAVRLPPPVKLLARRAVLQPPGAVAAADSNTPRPRKAR